jgi:hypothetical protein
MTKATELWIEEQNQRYLAEEGHQILLIDHNTGAWKYSNRRELYDRY